MGSITNLKDNKTLFIPCGCRNEILVIEYDYEINAADFAIYENITSYRSKMSFWQRLRYCYQILVHKKPYADQIFLDNKQLKELRDFLKEILL
ncbi:hypothetical protein EBU24_01345 [bacterium]|nr:hypothetical protein [bacterium]